MTVGALCPIARYPNCDTKWERHKVSQYLCERAIGRKIIIEDIWRITMLSKSEYTEARKMVDAYHKASMEYIASKGNGIPVEVSSTFPFASRVDNALRSAVEVYGFCANAPSKYFLYVNLEKRIVTTWTGDKLGNIIGVGASFRSNFGDSRRYIWIHAINGQDYVGVFYESAGDYARIKALKYPL